MMNYRGVIVTENLGEFLVSTFEAFSGSLFLRVKYCVVIDTLVIKGQVFVLLVSFQGFLIV